MVADPVDYPWSSHACNARGAYDPLVHPHPSYLALGISPEAARLAYRAWIREEVPPTDVEDVRLHLQRQYACGLDRFRKAIEAQVQRRVGPAKIGRPREVDVGREDESALYPLLF